MTIRGDLSYLEQQGYLNDHLAVLLRHHSPLNQKRYNHRAIVSGTTNGNSTTLRTINRDRDTLFLGHGTICRKIIPFSAK